MGEGGGDGVGPALLPELLEHGILERIRADRPVDDVYADFKQSVGVAR